LGTLAKPAAFAQGTENRHHPTALNKRTRQSNRAVIFPSAANRHRYDQISVSLYWPVLAGARLYLLRL
jgi:hypothetical protein